MIAGYHSNISMAAYLADPAPEPSLSTGTVETLVMRTPLHAYAQHPRLGGRVSDHSSRADMGSAVHAGIHGGEEVVFCGEVEIKSGSNKGKRFVADDWATSDAKEFRDSARAAGKIPLLEWQRPHYDGAVKAAQRALLGYGAASARHEETMLWQLENGVWCRGRADFLGEHPELGPVDIDTKTCDDADPFSWPRRSVPASALDIQAGLRSIGHRILGEPRTMLWMLVEIEPPYAVSFVGVSDSMLALATRKIYHASNVWRNCLDSNTWPGYSDTPAWAEASAWAELELDARGVRS